MVDKKLHIRRYFQCVKSLTQSAVILDMIWVVLQTLNFMERIGPRGLESAENILVGRIMPTKYHIKKGRKQYD